MKLINPSFEIIQQKDIFQHIELCGRISYKSENKITEDSAKQFVDNLIKNNHGSVLEHGTIYLLFTKEQEQLFTKYTFNPYSKIFFDTDNKVYVTTNYRVLIENNWLLDMRFACQTPDIYHPKRKTVRIICSRSISHALVRHRTFSFTQESTRFCNYSNNKFNKEITFIKPYWFDAQKEFIKENFLNTLKTIESVYMECLHYKMLPQEARDILPNTLKTELYMTGFIDDWKHFFSLRTAKSIPPDMKEALASPLYKQFKDLNYV